MISLTTDTRRVLESRVLQAGYGSSVAVRDLDLHVVAGAVVALLGPNGAGKTTTIMTFAGAIPILGGQVLIDGRVTDDPLYRRVRRGLALVTERGPHPSQLRPELQCRRHQRDEGACVVPRARRAHAP